MPHLMQQPQPPGPNGFPPPGVVGMAPPQVSPGGLSATGGGAMMSAAALQAEQVRRRQDYETLCQIISQWNANRLDLFALSIPNEVRKEER